MTPIVLIVALTLFYTFEGGMTAVIWTDVVQMFLYVFGAVVSLFVILNHIPGGMAHVIDVVGPLGKLQVFDFRFELMPAFFSTTYSFWAGIVGGCFLTTASHGTEQLMVQRLLAARSQRDSRTALFASWFVIFFQFVLFLVIGAILFVYYRETGTPPPQPPDRLYPQFIWQQLPVGLAGLVIAAILAAAMSNLSAALNSLASTTVIDFLKPIEGPGRRTEASYLKIARGATIAWAVVLIAIGYVARHWGGVLEAGLTIASIAYGGLLGVFLLGILTKRVGERAAMLGMCAGLALVIYIKLATPIAWTWYVAIGTLTTFGLGWAASFVFREKMFGGGK
jgi:SSS family transporter